MLQTPGRRADKCAMERNVHARERRALVRQTQRAALWKWRWLGLRGSTPGFKVSLALVLVAAVYVLVRALTAL